MRLPPVLESRASTRDRFFRLLLCHFFGVSAMVASGEDTTAPASATTTVQEGSASAEGAAPAPVSTGLFTPNAAGGFPGATPASPIAGTSQIAVATPLAGVPMLGLGNGLTAWGLLHLYPHFLYSVSYGNGLQSSPGRQENTVINTISPGLAIRLGPHWSLDYTPSLRFYSSHEFKHTTDHSVSLNGGTTYGDWTLGLSQSYSLSSQPLIETGAQTEQETFNTGIGGTYQMNSKVSLSLGANQTFRYLGGNGTSQQLTDTREWSTMDWFNYQIEPRLSGGLGAGFTYDNLSVGSDMTSEQVQARLGWIPGNKLSLTISGGIDVRQFLNSTAPTLLSPLYSAAISYRVFEPTTLSLSASRSVIPSYFENQVTDSTGIGLGLHQRLLQRLSLDITGSYGSSVYHGTTGNGTAASQGLGNYNTTSVSASLSTVLLKRVNSSIFFQRSYNNSGAAIYSYTTTQVGLTLGYQF